MRPRALARSIASALAAPLGGRQAPPAAATGPVVAAVGGFASTESGTTLNVPGVPGVRATDLIVLVQMCNKVPSVPSGFTLLASATDVGTGQRLDVYTAPGGTPSPYVLNQDVAGRLQGIGLLLRPPTGKSVLVDTHAESVHLSSTTNPEPMQGLTPTADGLTLALAACQLTGASAQFTPSSGWNALLTGGTFNLRLALAARASKAGEAESGSFTASAFPDGSASTWNKSTINFKAG